eukprot:SAG11_NODE_16982_length_532_cov_0.822171_1_plen_88_part_00
MVVGEQQTANLSTLLSTTALMEATDGLVMPWEQLTNELLPVSTDLADNYKEVATLLGKRATVSDTERVATVTVNVIGKILFIRICVI